MAQTRRGGPPRPRLPFSASFKLLAPIDAIQAQLPLDGAYIRAIGTIELLGALGLVLPSWRRIAPVAPRQRAPRLRYAAR